MCFSKYSKIQEMEIKRNATKQYLLLECDHLFEKTVQHVQKQVSTVSRSESDTEFSDPAGSESIPDPQNLPDILDTVHL